MKTQNANRGKVMNNEEKSIKINIFGKIARLFINRFQLSILVILLILSVGLLGFANLPKESLPEFEFPEIIIQTTFPGASPEDVESLVTKKIENKVKDLEDIDTLNSETGFGISVVNATFLDSVDIDRKKIELDNALREISFTDGVGNPESFVLSTADFLPLMNISVAGDYDLPQLTNIANDIKDEIEGVKGIDNVTINGEVSREIEVVLDELKMMKYGIDYNQIREAIQVNNFDAPLGELPLNGVRYNLRVDESYTSLSDIENTFIKEGVYIKDVARVVEGLAPVDSYNRTFIRGLNEEALPSLFLTVNREVNSDVIGTSLAVKELLKESKGTLYTDDVTVNVSNDLAVNVDNDLGKIESSAWSGLLVVIVVLFLFIGLRESLIVSISIPLSLLGTLGILNLFNLTFNTFVVLGLIVALGLLVDNSIIVMENIDRLHRKEYSIFEAAFYGTNQVAFPVASATMTTLAAFFPLAILPGVLGNFVSPIAVTIMITVSVSLFVSLAITPSLSAKILAGRQFKLNKRVRVVGGTIAVAFLSYIAFRGVGSIWITIIMVSLFTVMMFLRTMYVSEKGLEETRLTERYSRFIWWIVIKKRRGTLVLAIGFLALLISLGTFFTGILKVAFFPVNEPTSLALSVDTAGGRTLEETDEVVRDIEDKLYEIDTITQFNSTVGGNEIDFATISIELDTEALSGFENRNLVESALENVPGAVINIQGIASGPPVGKPIEIGIYGEDLAVSNEFASEVYSRINSIDGVYNVESSVTDGVPQLVVDIDEGKALTYGLTPIQMTNQLRGELNGIKAATLKRADEEVDIVLRKDLTAVDTVEKVENFFIAGPTGNMFTLSSFADIEEVSGISGISRKEGERVITISADLREGYNVNDVVNQIKSIYPENTLPQGIEIRFAGDVEGIEQNFGNLLQSMILAVFLVFIILTLQFKSIGQPFIILTTLPMGFIGVIWGLVLTGNEFGFYAFMGLVALIGIAVNDAIVLIEYINYLRKQGKDVAEAIKEAGRTRLNPVLATTLTTISGVLPLAFKEAYYAQFSFALIFGLMVTTLLTLVYIPTIYGLFNRKDLKP